MEIRKHDSKEVASHAISLPTAQESETLWMFSTFSGYRSVLADGLTQLTLWTGRLSPHKFDVRHLRYGGQYPSNVSISQQIGASKHCGTSAWIKQRLIWIYKKLASTSLPPPKKKHTEKHPLKKKTSTTIKASHHKITRVFFPRGRWVF